MNWHKFEPCCPQCDTPFTILAIFIASDGEIMINGVCIVCGVFLDLKTTGAKLVAKAVLEDMDDTKRTLYTQQPNTEEVQ